jgi:hypothetical protein
MALQYWTTSCAGIIASRRSTKVLARARRSAGPPERFSAPPPGRSSRLGRRRIDDIEGRSREGRRASDHAVAASVPHISHEGPTVGVARPPPNPTHGRRHNPATPGVSRPRGWRSDDQAGVSPKRSAAEAGGARSTGSQETNDTSRNLSRRARSVDVTKVKPPISGVVECGFSSRARRDVRRHL